jgi:predicted RNase H-like nuclease (RuvC/YqgF family)
VTLKSDYVEELLKTAKESTPPGALLQCQAREEDLKQEVEELEHETWTLRHELEAAQLEVEELESRCERLEEESERNLRA